MFSLFGLMASALSSSVRHPTIRLAGRTDGFRASGIDDGLVLCGSRRFASYGSPHVANSYVATAGLCRNESAPCAEEREAKQNRNQCLHCRSPFFRLLRGGFPPAERIIAKVTGTIVAISLQNLIVGCQALDDKVINARPDFLKADIQGSDPNGGV